TVSGTAEAGGTVTVYDGTTVLGTTTADAGGAWSFTDGRALADGSTHSYSAVATDAAGNTGTASNTFTAHTDTSAPAAPVIAGVSDDTGRSNADGVTNDQTLTVSGTAEANALVSVYDGAALLGTALADGTGAWSFADGRTLADGSTH